jgi:hypothetical protein
MAYVAFDLDNTLGFFEYTNPLSFFWSPEMLTNPEQARANPGVAELPPALLRRLAQARENFYTRLRTKHALLARKLLRTNLSRLLDPLLRLRRRRDLRSVIIYSNTGVTPSLEFAKRLIEDTFYLNSGPRGFFDVLADHWHPLRVHDRVAGGGDLHKTTRVLKDLFHEATGVRPPSSKILFVDDRQPKHELAEAEADGLTYLVPTPYYVNLGQRDRLTLVAAAIEAMHDAGLLENKAYLESAFCNRKIPLSPTTSYEVNGFKALVEFVIGQVMAVKVPLKPWENDSDEIDDAMNTFLKKI